MIYGATVVLRQGYKNEYFWPDIAEHNCNVAFLLGAIANFLWQQPPAREDVETPLTKVGMFPIIPEHEQFTERFGVELSSGYGCTENPCPMIHHFGEPFPTNQCVGYPTGRYDVKILDAVDRECGPGEMGRSAPDPKLRGSSCSAIGVSRTIPRGCFATSGITPVTPATGMKKDAFTSWTG